MKYYLFDYEHNCRGTAKDIKAALQVFGEMCDEFPEASKDWTVEIYLEVKPNVEKFYNVYYLPDFLNKSPEFYEATPEQEDAHAEKNQEDAPVVKIKDQNGDYVTVKINREEKPKLMSEDERKAFNAGNNRSIKELAASFTDEEYKAVLPCIPTGFIIGELARRLQEYDNATNEIQHILSNMKIYQSDKKGM